MKKDRKPTSLSTARIYMRRHIQCRLEESLEAAAELINRGSKVAILAGAGCLKPGLRFCSSPRIDRRSHHQTAAGESGRTGRHPYTTGGIGLLGTAPSQEALQECDTLIIAGSGFPYMEFYPKPGQAKTVQIDIDPARIGLRHPVDVGLAGECRAVLQAFLPLIRKKKDQSFLERGSEEYEEMESADGRTRHAKG